LIPEFGSFHHVLYFVPSSPVPSLLV
jgi:hypothetical protein